MTHLRRHGCRSVVTSEEVLPPRRRHQGGDHRPLENDENRDPPPCSITASGRAEPNAANKEPGSPQRHAQRGGKPLSPPSRRAAQVALAAHSSGCAMRGLEEVATQLGFGSPPVSPLGWFQWSSGCISLSSMPRQLSPSRPLRFQQHQLSLSLF
jgi:hypothetical protein